jgi:hypothetical protein
MYKTIVTNATLTLLACFHSPAGMAADQTLKFKLATFYVGEKDAVSHFEGVAILPDGSLGTKDYFDKAGENGASTGNSTFYLPKGSLELTYSSVSASNKTGGHFKGRYLIASGAGAYQRPTGTGGFEGDWGDKSPHKGAALMDVELDIKTP